MNFRKKHLVEINYKSGIQRRFWVYKFTVKDGLGSIEWENVNGDRPIVLNVDRVESVWKIRETRFWCGRV